MSINMQSTGVPKNTLSLNYIRDFLSKLAKYTSPLFQLFKKKPPPWKQNKPK